MGYCRRSSKIIFDGYNFSRHRLCWRRNFGEFGEQGKRPCVGSNSNSNNEFVHSKGWRRWIWNVENAVAMVVFGGGSVLILGTGKIETVPFTKRKQLVTENRSAFEAAGERKCDEIKQKLKEKVVDPVLPESVRVGKITEDLIEGFRRRSRKEKWHVDEEKRLKQVEFVFVDFPANRISYLPGGKFFVVFCDMQYHWGRVKDDARIAAYIAHEIGRSVARHDEEKVFLRLIPCIPLFILHDYLKQLAMINSMPSLLRLPFARSVVYGIAWMAISRLLLKFYTFRMEAEADYIGVVVAACAGYDPRVAMQVREWTTKFNGDSRLEKMRTQLLAIHMDETLSIYFQTLRASPMLNTYLVQILHQIGASSAPNFFAAPILSTKLCTK